VTGETLSTRALNRALLARQLLLERSSLSVPDAVEQVGGLQTQYAPSGYVGLWSRLAGFERDDLTQALEERVVVQATLLRVTIHVVSRREYWAYALGVRAARREQWRRTVGRMTGAGEDDLAAAADRLRVGLADGPRDVKELGDIATGFVGTHGLWVDLVRVHAQEPGDLKEDARDFALWKATKAHEDTQWDSPWGPGRPGWHIECSAMAEKHLGPEFEIHGGGLDLRFPHHENELAQSRGAGRPFARHWAHNGMLQLAEEKMSKSVGNIVSLREALDTYGREAILVFFLSGHYRGPLDYSDEAMEAARAQAENLRNAFRLGESDEDVPGWEVFVEALDDDFNTAEALALMHTWRAAGRLDLLDRALGVFGLKSLAALEEAPAEVVNLASRRKEARERGEFEEADRLRKEVEAAGWRVRDKPDGFDLVPL